jgi:hypothetical protein
MDEALARLGDADRHALLLRFFEQRALADVGAALGVSEDGARKRVQRALERLRHVLGKRGVVVPLAILTSVLAANGAPAVPATLALGITAATTTPLVEGTLALMAWSKTKIAVVTIAALLLVNSGALLTVFILQKKQAVPQTTAVAAPLGPFSEDDIVLTEFVAPPADNDGFVSLFNGRDLTGWNYNPHVWSVSNGVIVGRAPADSRQTVHYMAWAGGEVDDFELRLKVRTANDCNSGVPLRARWGAQRWFPGYQAEIHGLRSGLFVIAGAGRERQLCREGWRTVARDENGADILESVEPLPDADRIAEVRAAVQSGEWCDFAVVAQGSRFVIRVNNVTVVDTRDDHSAKFVPMGMLGLEYSHKRATEDAVEFKEIRFKRLAAGNP